MGDSGAGVCGGPIQCGRRPAADAPPFAGWPCGWAGGGAARVSNRTVAVGFRAVARVVEVLRIRITAFLVNFDSSHFSYLAG